VNQRAQLTAAKIVEGYWKVAKGHLEVKRSIHACRGQEKLREPKNQEPELEPRARKPENFRARDKMVF